MSFIITVYTNEGIIMASDSRTTYNTTVIGPDGSKIFKQGTQITDSTYKTFMCNNRIGLSTCGDASINNMPIAGFIDKFIMEEVNDESTVESVAEAVLKHFSSFDPLPSTHFIVAGYDEDNKQHISRVLVKTSQNTALDTTVPGVLWDGEVDILKRLIRNVGVKIADETYEDQPNYTINYNYFTLQDAIDFAEYAVDVTIKTMAFQSRVKTVGGPIDILAIKPSGAFWVKRKELHA